MSLLNKIIVEYYGIYAKKILLSKNIICDKNSLYELHMLTCERDFLESLWCLKTFYHYSGIRTRLIIHDDGTLSNHNVEKFKKHFVGCEIILKKDADNALKKYLKEYEFCIKYRFSNPPSALSMKLFDPVYYSHTKKY